MTSSSPDMALVKAASRARQDQGVQLYEVQEQVAGLQASLSRLQASAAQAAQERSREEVALQQAEAELASAKRAHAERDGGTAALRAALAATELARAKASEVDAILSGGSEDVSLGLASQFSPVLADKNREVEDLLAGRTAPEASPWGNGASAGAGSDAAVFETFGTTRASGGSPDATPRFGTGTFPPLEPTPEETEAGEGGWAAAGPPAGAPHGPRIATVAHMFIADYSQPDELSVFEGDAVEVLEESEGWALVKDPSGAQGLAQASQLQTVQNQSADTLRRTLAELARGAKQAQREARALEAAAPGHRERAERARRAAALARGRCAGLRSACAELAVENGDVAFQFRVAVLWTAAAQRGCSGTTPRGWTEAGARLEAVCDRLHALCGCMDGLLAGIGQSTPGLVTAHALIRLALTGQRWRPSDPECVDANDGTMAAAVYRDATSAVGSRLKALGVGVGTDQPLGLSNVLHQLTVASQADDKASKASLASALRLLFLFEHLSPEAGASLARLLPAQGEDVRLVKPLSHLAGLYLSGNSAGTPTLFDPATSEGTWE
ncbi:hypothetical protein APUTEX25_002694 [Auxenochlorella protothecoides]|uniref:SH3 domain-containing protein n=1 Tax=Auxenochlorella protothecoides TaxID=3075 RepID=A0A3M7KUV1_AUXPR|nr:hypothetical protein APUTEX25_002694 [Auxenochlorella protothecoides]|eukprot:RMZ54117.1 hypothetical protein APUTEX25_002694 [Auxenochlorella protothecoides]